MKTVTYQNLLHITVKENSECLVLLDNFHIKNVYPKFFKNDILWNKIITRETLAKKLSVVNTFLKNTYDIHLLVTFWYRSLEVQTQRFLERLHLLSKVKFYPNALDLYEEVHKTIAVPTVAGHPTWGAVDITLVNQKGEMLDFWTPMYDYSTPWYETFAKWINKKARENRMLLREVMMQEWFAPFDGEYRHFSYGDRERAYYYNKPYAIYQQVHTNEVQHMLITL
jgi:D-alanyl-D-alanine dipeptidase